jgi:bifunctional DNase/RNase
MKNTLIPREVAICRRRRCPILILQEARGCGEVVIPLGLVEACLLGCAIHEGGVGTERCAALLAEALKEANGEIEDIVLSQTVCGLWWAELVFQREDGGERRQRCRPADAATLAVAFGLPLSLKAPQEEPETSEGFSLERVAHWLATLAPDDFLRLEEESS